MKQGKILAYPTEAVYGLGCDPFNQCAVERLIALKQRDVGKGFILLIADWAQLTSLVGTLSDEWIARVQKTWPGPVTWVFPKAPGLPDWLTGVHDGVAIRMSAHPIAHQLCLDGTLVSTSANISGSPPAMDRSDLQLQFPQGIDAVFDGALGGALKPSSIFDVCSGRQLR